MVIQRLHGRYGIIKNSTQISIEQGAVFVEVEDIVLGLESEFGKLYLLDISPWLESLSNLIMFYCSIMSGPKESDKGWRLDRYS